MSRTFTVGLSLLGVAALCIGGVAAVAAGAPAPAAAARTIKPVPKPLQVPPSPIHALLLETTRFIRADEARKTFDVNGKGLTAAVLDTGLRITHQDFTDVPGRVPAQRNFSGGADDDVTDGNGHGTNVAGIIGANRLHIGIAPGA